MICLIGSGIAYFRPIFDFMSNSLCRKQMDRKVAISLKCLTPKMIQEFVLKLHALLQTIMH